MVKIVIESLLNAGSDGQLCLREHPLYRLRQHMGSGVTQGCQALRILRRTYLQLAVLLHHGTQINHLAVHLGAASRSRQSLADIQGNIIYALTLCILLY